LTRRRTRFAARSPGVPPPAGVSGRAVVVGSPIASSTFVLP